MPLSIVPLSRAQACACRSPIRALMPVWIGFGFDVLRFACASAVTSGWLRRSLLASAAWDRSLHALEWVLWMPLARQR